MSNEKLSTFWQHIEEFRLTLLKIIAIICIGTAIAACFYPYIFQWLSAPLNDTASNTPSLIILKPTEGIIIAMKVCFWVGLAATSPIWLFQLLLFILPALKSEEKKGILPFLLATILFFFLGVFFSYQVTIPLANHYLMAFNLSMGVNMWTLSHYVDYSFILMFGNGLAFEVTVILFFLVHYGWVTHHTLREKRKYFIVSAFIFSAIITPPDIMTQLLLAIPLTLLYEAAIIYAKLRKSNTKVHSLNTH
jgi:sec-independent protein translocase protein TatC